MATIKHVLTPDEEKRLKKLQDRLEELKGQISELERKIDSLKEQFPHNLVLWDIVTKLGSKTPYFVRMCHLVQMLARERITTVEDLIERLNREGSKSPIFLLEFRRIGLGTVQAFFRALVAANCDLSGITELPTLKKKFQF